MRHLLYSDLQAILVRYYVLHRGLDVRYCLELCVDLALKVMGLLRLVSAILDHLSGFLLGIYQFVLCFGYLQAEFCL